MYPSVKSRIRFLRQEKDAYLMWEFESLSVEVLFGVPEKMAFVIFVLSHFIRI